MFDDYIGTTLLLWFPYEQWKPKLEMAADKFFIGDARIRFLGDENEARALALAVERRLIALQESGRIAQICQWREDDACEADDDAPAVTVRSRELEQARAPELRRPVARPQQGVS